MYEIQLVVRSVPCHFVDLQARLDSLCHLITRCEIQDCTVRYLDSSKLFNFGRVWK